MKLLNKGSWTFNDDVAARFNIEAVKHIPDYKFIISSCVEFLEEHFDKTARVCDVGSALGTTVQELINHGFLNTFGIEQSEAMIKKSKLHDRIIMSSSMPLDLMWDVVIMNWTLHFINDREEYLSDVFNSLNYGGILIITDKMDATPIEQEEYVTFKKSNGMSDLEIINKSRALDGVLITKPLDWYLDTLQQIGFSNIQIVHKKFMFYTIIAQRRIIMQDKILKFSADWCQPCKMLAKTMEALDLGLPVEEVDIDKNDQLAAEFKIRGVPTLILIRDGKEVARTPGTKTAEQLKQFAAG